MFVICVEVTIHLLSYNLHDCNFKFYDDSGRLKFIEISLGWNKNQSFIDEKKKCSVNGYLKTTCA